MAALAPEGQRLYVPVAYRPLWSDDYRRYFLWGARQAGRSWSVAHRLVELALKEPGSRILCVRETTKAADESQRQDLLEAIDDYGCAHVFARNETTEIRCANGSVFLLRGLKHQNGLRGVPRVHAAWIEEAQTVSRASAHDFFSTVIRAQGVRIFVTGNPTRPDDVIYEWCEAQRENKGVLWLETSWRDNPFFSADANAERLHDQRNNPEIYDHRWGGKFLRAGAETQFVTRDWLDACIELYEREHDKRSLFAGQRDWGYDPSEGGGDAAVCVARSGPFLEHVEDVTPPAGKSHIATQQVHDRIVQFGGRVLTYDQGGIGKGVAGWYQHLEHGVPYGVVGITFGMPPGGPDVRFGIRRNRDEFRFRNTQMGWAVRMRAQATWRRAQGDDVSLEHCLAIDPTVCNGRNGAPTRSRFMSEMTQPQWFLMSGDRRDMDKSPSGQRSPDCFDGVCLAYHQDVRNGLRIR